MQRLCGPFGFKNLFMPFERFLSTSMFFCSSIYIETALNFRQECNECTDILSWRLSLCLSRDSVLSHSLIRSLYFIQVLVFILLIHSVPFLHFSQILHYTNFFICILPCEIFSYPWWYCQIGDSSELNFFFFFHQSKASVKLYFTF